ncbi:MAG TPA: sigma 54-interacting transcriptional regulator [Polyangiaceae bacterium]
MPDARSNDETTLETLNDTGGDEDRAAPRPVGIGFVVLWSMDEPTFIGAWLPVTSGTNRGPRLLGRGPARADDEFPRLSSLRQRPEQNELLPPFGSEALSRVQLVIRSQSSVELEVENRGRRRLSVNGVELARCAVRPGDVLELGNRLVLLCAARPMGLGGSPAHAEHAFGGADAHGLVGESPAAWQLRTEIAFAARRNGHVLILGPTGSGKELVAESLHALSARPGALVSRNAATLPEALVDAELFGNPKGYPNPGIPEREGLIGAAHRGSLFLDEFADLPSGAQAHVLRVLDSGEYQRLGESQNRTSDFRLIAATNRPESALRADLLARFDFRIRVPDLAARREDAPLLLRHLFAEVTRDDPDLRARYALENGLPRLAPGFVRRLVQHPFSANVRELRYLLWRAVAESSDDALEWPGDAEAPVEQPGDELPAAKLQRALDDNNGSLEKTWRALGLPNRYVLRRLVAKHGLTVTRRGPRA